MRAFIVSVDAGRAQACRERIESSFVDVHLGDESVFVKHPQGDVAGCFDSHMKRYRQWLSESGDEPHCIVFEDDVIFSRRGINASSLAAEASTADPRFDLLYLGHRLVAPQDTWFEKVSPSLLRVKTNDLHAYILSRRAATALVTRHAEFDGTPVDVVLREGLERTYAVFPMIAHQEGFNGVVERMCQLLVYAGPLLSTRKRRVTACAALMVALLLYGLSSA